MAFEHYDKCSLLLPMDGANDGTVFTDWSPNPSSLSAFGSAVTSTEQYLYYGSSLKLNGTTSYLIDNKNDSKFRIDGNFTISARVRMAADTGSFQTIASFWGDSGTPVSNIQQWMFGYNKTTGVLAFEQRNSDNTYESHVVPVSLALSDWHYVAVTYDGSSFYFFVSGILVGIVARTKAMASPALASLRIGCATTTSAFFNGNIQDVLIIKGVALWTDDFTPPARLIGELSNASALAPVEDETGTPAERTIIAVPRSYPEKVFKTVSDVNGDFTLRAPAVDCSVIALHEGSPAKNDLIHRVTPV